MISKQTKLKLENYIRKSKKINNEIWYHQTNQNASNSILKNGFRVFPGYGQARYTEGVYFLHHPDGGYGDVTLTATINGTFVDYSDDDFLFDWVDFKNSVEWDNYSDLTKIVQQIHPECDGIVFQSILVVWYPNKVIKNVNVLKSTKGIFMESSKKLKSTLKSYIRKIVKEERQKLREAKIYNSFKDKYGNEYKFDNYLDFAKFWFNSPQKFLKSQFPDNFDALQRYATNSKEARSKYVK